MSTSYTDQLRTMQMALEECLLAHINDFERKSGLSVHSVKVYRAEPVNGQRIASAIEVAAMLR